jgi:RNA-directed DNA polymerase
MRRFLAGWKTLGHERRLDAHIVNYADDCAPRRWEGTTFRSVLEHHAA